MITRRAFLIGAGSFLTQSFVADALACISETGLPLLHAPKNPRETLFAYWGLGGYEDHEGYLLTVGAHQFEPPEPPLWKDYVVMEGYSLDRLSDIRKVYRHWSLSHGELRTPLDGYSWETLWEYRFSPSARAHDLLRKLRLDARVKGLEKAGRIAFHQFPNPISSAKWVEAKDDLSLSLLQARLRELDAPISVRIGDAELC